MGLIREPEGVDFLVKSRPLTDRERKEISRFIENEKKKRKMAAKKGRTRRKYKAPV